MDHSVEDELGEIEQSVGGGYMPPSSYSSDNNSPQNQNNDTNNAKPENRGKSSIGSVDTNSKDYEDGDILVDFPSRGASTSTSDSGGTSTASSSLPSAGNKAKQRQRNSVSLNPIAMRGALAGLSLDDDDDDKSQKKETTAPSPQQVPNATASGGPEHRPLVGGFAAAAYEAARVDYYKKQGKDVTGHNPPKPQTQRYPRYP